MGGARAGDDDVDTDNDDVGGIQVHTNGQRPHGSVGCDGGGALYPDGGGDCVVVRRLAASVLFRFLRFLAPNPPSFLLLPFLLLSPSFSLSLYSMNTFRLFSSCLPIDVPLP